MEDKKRTIMAVIIIAVVLLAVVYSFFLNLFAPTPRLELANPDASQSLDPVRRRGGGGHPPDGAEPRRLP